MEKQYLETIGGDFCIFFNSEGISFAEILTPIVQVSLAQFFFHLQLRRSPLRRFNHLLYGGFSHLQLRRHLLCGGSPHPQLRGHLLCGGSSHPQLRGHLLYGDSSHPQLRGHHLYRVLIISFTEVFLITNCRAFSFAEIIVISNCGGLVISFAEVFVIFPIRDCATIRNYQCTHFSFMLS